MRRIILCGLLFVLGAVKTLHAQGMAFTYQGYLNNGTNPANGTYDLTAAIYNSSSLGGLVAGPLTNAAVPVVNGQFTMTLDFGAGVFTGASCWLQLGVRTNGAATFTNLSPRQALTPTPYAIFANTASNLAGTVASAQLSGTYSSAVSFTSDGNSFTGSGANLANLNASQLTFGTVADARLSANVPLLNGNQVFTGSNTFSGAVVFGGNGAGLTNLNASLITTGTLADARLSSNVALLNGNQAFSGNNLFSGGSNSFSGAHSGNGMGLTNLNASQLTSGTVADARLSTNATLLNGVQIFSGTNTFTGSNLFTGLNTFSGGSNNFNGAFSGNGANLTNLNATQLTSGTMADARQSTNVALLNHSQIYGGSNVFTGPNTFTGSNFFSGVNIFTNRGNSYIGSFFGNGLVGWIVVSGTATQAMSNAGYLLTNALLTTVTLPSSPIVGDIVRISGAGAGGWVVAQNAGQSILGNFSGYTLSYWTLSGASVANWFGLASSADGNKLAAVAPSSGIYTSPDAGVTWVQTSASSSSQWHAIASSANGTKLVAVVNNGGIYTSTNSGGTWVQSLSGTTSWSSVASSADGTKLAAVIDGGYIYTSANAGASWTQQLNSGSRNWSSVAASADGTKLVAAVNPGGIYTSSDSGITWPVSGAASLAWTGVASSSDGTKLVAVASGNAIFTSVNTGASWTQQTAGTPSGAAWDAVASSADGVKLAAAANGGGIYLSSDAGANWLLQTNAPNQNWTGISESSDGTKLAAIINNTSGGSGQIYYASEALQTVSTTGVTGYISGGRGTAVELQYIGNNQWMPVSSSGTIWAY